MAQAAAILAGIQSYLMATEETRATAAATTSQRTMNMLAPWLDMRR